MELGVSLFCRNCCNAGFLNCLWSPLIAGLLHTPVVQTWFYLSSVYLLFLLLPSKVKCLVLPASTYLGVQGILWIETVSPGTPSVSVQRLTLLEPPFFLKRTCLIVCSNQAKCVEFKWDSQPIPFWSSCCFNCCFSQSWLLNLGVKAAGTYTGNSQNGCSKNIGKKLSGMKSKEILPLSLCYQCFGTLSLPF